MESKASWLSSREEGGSQGVRTLLVLADFLWAYLLGSDERNECNRNDF